MNENTKQSNRQFIRLTSGPESRPIHPNRLQASGPDPLACDFCGLAILGDFEMFRSSQSQFRLDVDLMSFVIHDRTVWVGCRECSRIMGRPEAASRLAKRVAEADPELGGSDCFNHYLRLFRAVLPTLTKSVKEAER
jgi:hypothetical protein